MGLFRFRLMLRGIVEYEGEVVAALPTKLVPVSPFVVPLSSKLVPLFHFVVSLSDKLVPNCEHTATEYPPAYLFSKQKAALPRTAFNLLSNNKCSYRMRR
jgi:hypothetical protein